MPRLKKPDEPATSDEPIVPAPLTGITPENYAFRAKAFIEANGGKTFLICPKDRKLHGIAFPATPDQWTAWQRFFERKKIPHDGMIARSYYTVPTEWPSQFTRDAV